MSIDNISTTRWSGYIWMSDQTKPQVLLTPESIPPTLLSEGVNPFVVEAQLISEDGKTSLSISNVDGKVKVVAYPVETPANAEDEPVDFLPNRMENVKHLSFIRRWEAKPDSFCDNMETLVPTALIFRGFDK